MFFAIVVALAVLVALVRRVDLASLASTTFRGLGWLLVAVLLRFGLNPVFMPPEMFVAADTRPLGGLPPLGGLVYIASFLFAVAFLVANREKAGFWLILVGLVLNLTAIALNGGQMPGDPTQLERAGMLEAGQSFIDGRWSPFGIAGPDTLVPFLGDRILVPMPLRQPTLVSVGDLVIGAGAMCFINGVRLRPNKPQSKISRRRYSSRYLN